MFQSINLPHSVKTAASIIVAAGGTPTLVGGAVIDLLQNRTPKDWDIEVFGLSMTKLENIFSSFNPSLVGQAFGIIKVVIDKDDLDLSVPRSDNKTGVGHTGFEVAINPFMTVREAAKRRDFTINSMSIDLTDMTLNDPFNGLSDLSKGILRATDETLFVQDPLRALRAMQLLARKAKTVDPKTMILIGSMVNEFDSLPKERLFEEFKKLLLKANKPSMGLEFLKASGWLKHFNELEALIGTEQRAEWHAEGDVWTHSLLAVDAAAQVRHTVPESQRLAFMFGTLCHDLGKPATTITKKEIDKAKTWNNKGDTPRVITLANRSKKNLDDMFLTAFGHDKAGVQPVQSFLKKLCNNTKLIKLTSKLVETHMRPGSMIAGRAKIGAFAKLQRELFSVGGDLHLLGRLCQCDSCASSPKKLNKSLETGTPNWDHKVSSKLFEVNEQFLNDKTSLKPKVMGRDLISAGLKPSTQFRVLLAKALELQDSDHTLTKEELLSTVLGN